MDTTATMSRYHQDLHVITGVQEKVSSEEWDTRVNLAACYRLAWHYGWHHLHLNHISAKVPGTKDHYLLNPFGLLYNEVTASNLVKVDLEGNVLDDTPYTINLAGYTIHSAVHGARPDVNCVLHTHTRAGIAVSSMKCGLLPLHQEMMRFYDRVSYHDYEGVALDLDERSRLIASLGPDNKALILRNHGLLTCGQSIGEAFALMYHLEMSCQIQVDMGVTSADDPRFTWPSPETCAHAAQQINKANRDLGGPSWPAMVRLMDRMDPSFRD